MLGLLTAGHGPLRLRTELVDLLLTALAVGDLLAHGFQFLLDGRARLLGLGQRYVSLGQQSLDARSVADLSFEPAQGFVAETQPTLRFACMHLGSLRQAIVQAKAKHAGQHVLARRRRRHGEQVCSALEQVRAVNEGFVVHIDEALDGGLGLPHRVASQRSPAVLRGQRQLQR